MLPSIEVSTVRGSVGLTVTITQVDSIEVSTGRGAKINPLIIKVRQFITLPVQNIRNRVRY